MLHIFDVREVKPLVKGFGDSRPHKYWKRERIFRHGKPSWRYWYNTPEDRERYAREHGTEKEDEHVIAQEAGRIHKNLKKRRPPTSSITSSYLEGLLGKKAKVRISSDFERNHIQQFIDSEKAGLDVERNPIQRIAQALEMVPDGVKNLINVKNVKITTRSNRQVRAQFEQGEPPRPVPASWSDSDGNIVLAADGEGSHGNGGLNTVPHGESRFGKALTLTEELVWHEIGKQLLSALRSKRKPVANAWREVASMPGATKISAAANQNWMVDFNESFAGMMSHPMQMAQQCPERYTFFQKNGLVDLPPLDEMLKRSAGEFSWWETTKPTTAQKLYHQMVDALEEAPAASRTPYVSNKDEFYSVTVKGRTVYYRVGPQSIHEEDGWERMPDVIDKESGLPTYDNRVSQRYRAKGIVKEAYDEHGNRLDDTSAWFYLRQDETVSVPDSLAEYEALSSKDRATHGLGYQIYLALGESRGNPETERKAVAKYKKQGKLEEKRGDRYQWAPVKLSEAEFHAKTPSFAFDGMRSLPDKDQPYVMLEDGKPVIDPRTKKPLLAARVYEAVNPDGTKSQITVKESSEFEYGDTVRVPITRVVKDEDSEEVSEVTEWKDVVLNKREHKDKSAKGLAKQYGVGLDEILHRNGTFGQYQITDPIMASLINPNHKPITGRDDLVAMLKYAAEAQVERWVSIQVGTDVPPTAVQAKVRFDGAGSPLLVGDYWIRKLGKPHPRVSDLIEGGQLRGIDKAHVLKPRKRKIEIGHIVYAKVGDKIVKARLNERLVRDGKRVGYQVTPLPDQGLDDLPVKASLIRAIPDTIDLDRPDIRRRFVRQPQRDVLLYADDVRVNASGDVIPGSGVIRIKLPQNGVFGFEEISRAPGVRIAEGQLELDPAKIDAFREYVGGFIMDEHVQVKLNKALQSARIRETAKREKRVPLSEIVDDHGVVRADNLLRGCKQTINGEPFKLGSHQAELLQAMAQSGGRIIAAHFMGTGKTVSAIAAIKMMQNLEGKAKRVLVVAPKNTVQNWESEVALFTNGKATVIGASGIPGAKQVWIPPKELKEKPAGWSDEKYLAELDRLRKEAYSKRSSAYWKADEDKTDIVIVSREYFQQHEAELRRIGGFDGMVVDEAQGIQRENKTSEAVERWNPDLNFMMLLTGTPITNRVDTLPRYMKLISNGSVDWGSAEEFERTHMIESSVMKANGSKSPSKMDINPNSMRTMLPNMHRYIHVATSDDVKGKVMPAVVVDENTPAPMGELHSMMYRGYMKQLQPNDRTMLAAAANLGEDERKVLSEEGKRSVRVGRNIANAIGYKPPDSSEYVTYRSGKKDVVLKLPSWAELSRRYGGRFPSYADVESGKLEPNQYNEISRWFEYGLGVDYDRLAGRSILKAVTPQQANAMRKGEDFGNGISLGSKITNPEYGPEGAICRGMIKDGKIVDLEYTLRNSDGSVREVIRIPKGLRFIRDPRKKGAGAYFAGGLPDKHPDSRKYTNDWDYSQIVVDSVESGTSEGEEKSAKGVEKGQRPLEGQEGMNILRSPKRRRERLMFDLVMTSDNAKAKAMEDWIHNNTDPRTGGDPDAQHVIFAGAIGSGCRTVESKLRLMGYQDVNEALNDALRAPEDRPPATGKYFVTYINAAATLGDRDINSEIFKKVKDSMGRDTKTSMLVQRVMEGTSGKPLKEGQMEEGLSREQRDLVKKLFTDMEVPARVASVDDNGHVVRKYAYDSDLKPKDRQEVKRLEARLSIASDKVAVQKKIDAVYRKYLSDRVPLTRRQIDVFNNCQFMVASDAAQVGMNWGNATNLGMYDSLFSPMDEWQRITRVARMLKEAIPSKMEGTFRTLEKKIHKMGAETRFQEYKGTTDSAMLIVQDAIDQLPEVGQALKVAKINQAQFAEAYLAQRALERITSLRSSVEQKLRAEGRMITGAPKVRVGEKEDGTPIMEYPKVKASEITSADVTNEIVENHLLPFERELLRSRKYLKDVKRFLTSVEVPEMKKQTVERDGKKVKVDVPTGQMVQEAPVFAERSVLTRGRAKQVPVERLLSAIQNEDPISTAFDFIPATAASLSKFGQQVKPPPTPRQVELARKRRAAYQELRRKELAERKRIAASRREKRSK